jgi:LacI family transcriptional regulator
MTEAAKKAVTMRDIAKRCGVNHATVSRALRSDPRVKPETAKHILAEALAMGYDPSSQVAARRLAMQKTGEQQPNYLIATAVPYAYYKMAYFNQLYTGISEQLSLEDCTLITSYLCYPNDEQFLRRLQQNYLYHGARGFIAIPAYYVLPGTKQQTILQATFGNPPIVYVMDEIPGAASVITDDRMGGYLAAKRLLECGHRNILHLISPTFGHRQDRRLAGVRQAFAEHGLDSTSHLYQFKLPMIEWLCPENLRLRTAEGTLLRDGGHQLLKYLQQHPQITALIGINDVSAIWAWNVLESVGWRIPDDISIVGYDDVTEKLDAEGHNLLSVVHLPLRQAGREAARIIISILRGESARDSQVNLPVEFIDRQSIAAPRITR